MLKARSLVFDLFGDYLRYRGGEIRLRSLVSLMAPFGVPETTVRVVVTRLRREGWLHSRRDGRETVYALSDPAYEMLDEGRHRIFQRSSGPWDGHWHMVIYAVPETERALREQLRKKLAWLGFGPLSSSVYVSPHDRVDQLRDRFSGRAGLRIDHFRSRSDGDAADRDIASRAWDLTGLHRDLDAFVGRYETLLHDARAGHGPTGAAALMTRMHLVNDYRHFPFRDPDLPVELLGPGWQGRRAHEVFLEIHGLLRRAAEDFVDAILDGGDPGASEPEADTA